MSVTQNSIGWLVAYPHIHGSTALLWFFPSPLCSRRPGRLSIPVGRALALRASRSAGGSGPSGNPPRSQGLKILVGSFRTCPRECHARAQKRKATVPTVRCSQGQPPNSSNSFLTLRPFISSSPTPQAGGSTSEPMVPASPRSDSKSLAKV